MRLKILTLILMASLPMAAQRFYNLSVGDVEIDERVPSPAYSFPLYGDFMDSVYSVRVAYPEFIPMSSADQAAYTRLTGKPLPGAIAADCRVVKSRMEGSLEVVISPFAEIGGRPSILTGFMLSIEAEPRGRSSRAKSRVAEAAGRYATESVLKEGTWAKIRVPATGLYSLSDQFLKNIGFSDPSRVRLYGYGGNLQNETLVGEELSATDDLKEVATCTVGGQRLFYGLGTVSWSDTTAAARTRNPYSDYGYYFLTEADGEPLSESEEEFTGSFYPSPYYYHWLHETDGYAWFRGGRRLFDPTAITASAPMEIALPRNENSPGATLSLIVTAGETAGVSVAVGDSVMRTLTISVSGDYTKGAEATFSARLDNMSGQDTLRLSLTSGTSARLDYAQLTWDSPSPCPDLTATWPEPEYVCHITNQNHHADEQADMVIIIPTSQKLLAQAERLKAFHEQDDSLRVAIVPADELFNEFSSGTPDANAYRRYLKMLYDRATSDDDMPRYLLLMGDCVWDNRMLTTECSGLSPDDYLLCFESENSYNKVYCYVDDGWFCLLDDGEGTNMRSADKLDMAVGRFPVATAAQAEVMVDKTIDYARSSEAGDWQNTVVFMGDDGDSNLHMEDVDEAAEQVAELYPEFVVKKIMWDAYNREGSATGHTYPEVTKLIKKYQRQGALVMDYAGHGSENQISHEQVLKLQDFKDFSNQNLPLWVTASCDIMPFDGTVETIGEAAVLNENGGAVAFFGTTRTVYAYYNKPINVAFMRHVLSTDSSGKPIAIGEAARLAKNQMIEQGQDLTQNKLQYSLLGDPALRLVRPTAKMVVDSINGLPADGTSEIRLAAGSLASISGHVATASPIDGTVTATVRDTREQIVCLLNDTDEADEAFTYYDRPTTLFSGTDSIRQGRFSLTFAVPKDISYSGAAGLVNLYGVDSGDSGTRCHGYSTAFTVGGSELSDNDSIAPSVYCYLNSPDFTNGDTVNPTPYFVAEISDRDGINASGAGIGHDMQLTVDGDPQMSFSLNDNFSFDFGSYTSGSTYYSIPELEEGGHTLAFRVWDIQNNVATARLDFNVGRGLRPDIVSVACTDNPATESTRFIIQHDRAGSAISIVLDVMDMSGRLLWQRSEEATSDGDTYTIDWDLTTGGGRRLQTGVYLYRVRLASDGSSYASKAKKIVIIGNK